MSKTIKLERTPKKYYQIVFYQYEEHNQITLKNIDDALKLHDILKRNRTDVKDYVKVITVFQDKDKIFNITKIPIVDNLQNSIDF